MAVFAYKAEGRIAGGRVQSGTVAADTARQARDALRAQGLAVRSLREVRSGGPTVGRRRRAARTSDLVAFAQELSTLLGAGIPMVPALDAIIAQQRGRFQRSVMLLRDRIRAGASLAEAMREQAGVFDELTLSMVEVGEWAGTLDRVLADLAAFKQRAHALTNRLGNALIYPAIVLFVAVLVTLFLMTFVVPNLLETLRQSGSTLPLVTRIVKATSDALVSYGWLLVMGGGLFGASVALLLRRERPRRHWHRLLLRLPLLGPLIRKQTVVRLAATLATLTRSGVEFVQAVRIVRHATRNRVFREALARCEAAVVAGRDISAALASTGAFPPTVVQIVAVGQATGRLDQMLQQLADDYDMQVQTATQRLVAVLEPMLILALALVIGFIVLSVILPYFQASRVF